MRQSTLLILTVAILIIGVGMAFWLSRGYDGTLGDTCLLLSASIAESPSVDSGDADYEKYADLAVPPLHPDEALERFDLEEGFRIELVAHEPMVTHPVAMDVDADGRLWVVDMPSYMPVVDEGDWETAVREQVPQGRVVVLEDTSGDGVMDTYRVFREGLILPRAIKVLNDGILVGEPPNVWFIQDTTGDGKGDTREVIYDSYGDPNVENVEHLPNALIWGMDNWIHSANDGVESLRQVEGEWKSRPFRRLGQWGMTQDDWGRLYSANNTRPLQTHLVPYGYSDRHPGAQVSTGKNRNIAPSEPMWPAHAVGTNRSYRIGEEVREDDGTLRRATSTLGPVIYRGHQFSDEYRGNAFTPEPAGNLIKRFIIEDGAAEIEADAHFAYEGREFLTSTDERFRPVNMYNAPDGSLYVVDMYHGVIQHARFLTDHLREHVLEHGLHQGNSEFGRIYRIVREDREITYDTPQFSELTPEEVVEYLHHENGHLRDQAQQVLVQCSPNGVDSTLEEMVTDTSAEAFTRLQALWTLEGLSRSIYSSDRLFDVTLQAFDDPHPRIRAAAVRISEPAIKDNSHNVLARLEELSGRETSPFVQLQLLASLGESESEESIGLMAGILNSHPGSEFFQEMVLTGAYQREEQFAALLQDAYDWTDDESEGYDAVLSNLEEAASEEGGEEDLAHLSVAQRERFVRGGDLYSTCAACHGTNGEGVSGIGPALSGSEWVQADPGIVVRIVLDGFEGGVAEHPRQAVNIAGVMPEHGFLNDDQVAALLTYIRQSWENDASPIAPGEVAQVREESGERTELWTPEELREQLH